MKTQTVEVVKVEPSDGMYLKNKVTGEVYDGFIYLAKSLDINDFEEISAEEVKEEPIKEEIKEKQPREQQLTMSDFFEEFKI